MTAVPTRLLLLEDSAGDARLVQEALADEAPGEFTITTAERLADALARIQTERFDAVLCDLGLPDSTGLGTAQAIVVAAPALPLVVLTGSHSDDLGRAAIELGAQDYLVEGETRAPTIARTLRYAIERKRLENQLHDANETLERRVVERTAALAAANETLRAAEERFRGLVEQSIAGIYVVQNDKYVYVNPRFAEIFGYGSAEKIIGRDRLSVVAEHDRETVAERVRQRTESELANISYQFTGLRKDGSTIEIGMHGARATHDGRPAVIGLMQDISEKKRAEEQIQRYVVQLEKAFMSTVEVATTLGEMRDPYTAGHERRVAGIAVAIGAELGFDARRQEGLRVAGFLHDVGKITIPTEILSRPGKLSAIEFQLIKVHAQASYDVLKDVDFPWPVAQVALQHHERMDGSGYPQGLKGKAILLEARVMGVADVVEAMSSHRPYRPGLGIDKALAEIERGRGTTYDMEVADACLKLFREKGYTIPA